MATFSWDSFVNLSDLIVWLAIETWNQLIPIHLTQIAYGQPGNPEDQDGNAGCEEGLPGESATRRNRSTSHPDCYHHSPNVFH
jgi:hypothetical protein